MAEATFVSSRMSTSKIHRPHKPLPLPPSSPPLPYPPRANLCEGFYTCFPGERMGSRTSLRRNCWKEILKSPRQAAECMQVTCKNSKLHCQGNLSKNCPPGVHTSCLPHSEFSPHRSYLFRQLEEALTFFCILPSQCENAVARITAFSMCTEIGNRKRSVPSCTAHHHPVS